MKHRVECPICNSGFDVTTQASVDRLERSGPPMCSRCQYVQMREVFDFGPVRPTVEVTVLLTEWGRA